MTNKLLLLSLLSSFLFSSPLWSQCPNSGCDAAISAEVTTCLNGGNTELNITANLTISAPDDLAGISVCIKNARLTIDLDVNVTNTTNFSANGGNGIAVTIGGTTTNFNGNDGTLADLNADIAALTGTSTIGTVVQSLLPVTLISYRAIMKKNSVHLKWITGAELNNSHFVLEHSTNARDFKELGTIQSQGTSDLTQTYTYKHSTPQNGSNYYRLWQVDFDGHTENIGIIQIENSFAETLNVYPNPATAGTEIALNISDTNASNSLAVFLVDLNGQRRELYMEYSNRLSLPNDLVKGLYFLQIIQNETQQTLGINIQ